jgi:hypothetical protein
MKYFYRLQIQFDASIETHERLSEIFNVRSTDNYYENKIPSEWNYQTVKNEDDSAFDFVSVFMDIIDPHYDLLAQLGIQQSDITFWLLYEYENQCNMEFSPQQLRRLGDGGISLCISCWEKDSHMTIG